MNISTSTLPVTPAIASATPRRIGTAADTGQRIDVFAGQVLRSNVTDIAATGNELQQERFARPDRHASDGVVGFIRNGDAWDAVDLLTRDADGVLHKAWMPLDLRANADIVLDAVWMLADYGGNYSHIALPDMS